jgi:hypothetical protein
VKTLFAPEIKALLEPRSLTELQDLRDKLTTQIAEAAPATSAQLEQMKLLTPGHEPATYAALLAVVGDQRRLRDLLSALRTLALYIRTRAATEEAP